MKKVVQAVLLFCLLASISGYHPDKAAASGEYTAKVFGSSINVRSEPSIEASVVGSLQNGDLVTVSSEEHGWLKVTKGKVSGWAAGYYLKKINGSGAVTASATDTVAQTPNKKKAQSDQAAVLADALRIRSGAGLNYKVLGGLSKGELVTVLAREDGWAQIRTEGGQIGWVSAQYIGAGAAGKTASGKAPSGVLAGKVIVIDPGHGGSDPGKIGTRHNTLEKELNLSTSFYLAEELRGRGAHVVMTRTKDEQKPALSDRVKTSRSAGADAFVSIHYNSSEKNTSGILTFYYSETKDESLARAVEGRLAQGIGLRSNGISYGDLHVLRENETPSTLVELGFLSNAKDEAIVRESGYQKKAAAAIANGLADYFK
ncbi:N-acetylmuramoyl-L-alanine amidase [Paenibacillus oenotherae]|uniref:N-acetylmuramoyl-L-alanine amidase n=1 Tax=Paenibacillus oenotherae TaxID=1435645 RepID=A0ABS7DAI9_9BACL|nr:N-acetylmuramoyl-L-alanine amidase [Paenibacillus oenotherae]MBW7476957.1 N-acetylmuramoyl-L-alanine amidase [Paenibacillus oenotherae]